MSGGLCPTPVIVANAPVPLKPTHANQTLPQIINILPFCLVDSLLNYAPSFVVNWVEVMAVRLPQIWRDKCLAVGFTQLLSTASLHTLQSKVAVYTTRTTDDWERPVCLDMTYCGRPSWLMSAPPLQPDFLQYMRTSSCHRHAIGRCFMFFAAYSVTYQVLPLSNPIFTLYPEVSQ